jgi:RNA polymerase primary sigma factor
MPTSTRSIHHDDLIDRALSGDEGYIALDRETERTLADRARRGDDQAAWTLAMANQNFVRSLAQRYLRPEIELDDLVAEGMVGLIEAARRFDADRGVKFITYGAWWIKRSLLRFLRTFEHPVHVPKYKQHELQEFKRARQRLTQELGRAPRVEELCAATGQDERSVREHSGLACTTSSLEDDEVTTLADVAACDGLGDAEEMAVMRDALLRLDEVLPVLDDRERRILTARFGLDGSEPMTLSELGQQVGLTKERIRQIEKQACARLAEAMEDAVVAPKRRTHRAA